MMIAKVQHEKYMVNTYILSIIISKLGHWSELNLIFLFEVDKGIGINFSRIILSFELSINLQINRTQKLTLDVKEVIEQ